MSAEAACTPGSWPLPPPPPRPALVTSSLSDSCVLSSCPFLRTGVVTFPGCLSRSAGQRRNCICTLHSPSQVLRSVAWTPLGARCSPHQRWLQCGSSGQFDLCNLRAGPRQGSDLRRDSLRWFRGIRERRKRGWVNSVASLCRGQRADFGSSLSDREWSGLGHTKLRTGVPRSGADRRILLNEAPAATCSSSATSCRRCKPGSQPSKTQFGVNDFQNK